MYDPRYSSLGIPDPLAGLDPLAGMDPMTRAALERDRRASASPGLDPMSMLALALRGGGELLGQGKEALGGLINDATSYGNEALRYGEGVANYAGDAVASAMPPPDGIMASEGPFGGPSMDDGLASISAVRRAAESTRDPFGEPTDAIQIREMVDEAPGGLADLFGQTDYEADAPNPFPAQATQEDDTGIGDVLGLILGAPFRALRGVDQEIRGLLGGQTDMDRLGSYEAGRVGAGVEGENADLYRGFGGNLWGHLTGDLPDALRDERSTEVAWQVAEAQRRQMLEELSDQLSMQNTVSLMQDREGRADLARRRFDQEDDHFWTRESGRDRRAAESRRLRRELAGAEGGRGASDSEVRQRYKLFADTSFPIPESSITDADRDAVKNDWLPDFLYGSDYYARERLKEGQAREITSRAGGYVPGTARTLTKNRPDPDLGGEYATAEEADAAFERGEITQAEWESILDRLEG